MTALPKLNFVWRPGLSSVQAHRNKCVVDFPEDFLDYRRRKLNLN